ncbi:hypothetical protein GCM10011579_062780 [Streptomyces albiflavescens]|uniref:Uncharacterized protein n=1 Tax=Streptomyces albiflavescens TaxID=1623582 RepID=A0A917Y9W5_9ACTN|nr:hypothetical protein [Streptomyces albiflavescens]GGN78960.1 hypothetical protein GCM10011579_062780 [Streptomyces albiflavescens]
MAPGRAPFHAQLLGGVAEGLPERQRERPGVPELLQQAERGLPLVGDEVLPDVAHRDVVLGGGLLGDQEAGRFEYFGHVHALIVDHL